MVGTKAQISSVAGHKNATRSRTMALWSIWCYLALFGGRSAGQVFTVNQDGGTGKNGVDSEAPGERWKFAPTWNSLDARPLPAWYDEAKFGILIHWGVFSVSSFGSEQFWHSWQTESGSSTKYRDFMKQRYPPSFTYQDFAKEFTAEFFNATEWSKLFEAAGAKYVVLTSKHHEGYTLWPSKRSFSWNSMDVGPKRDLVGELATAIRENTKMRFGLYYSLFEWYNPLWLADQSNNFTSDDFVTSKTLPELRELVELYKPEVIWSDGGRDAPDTYWKSKEFLAWLYNESPVRKSVVVNDRWGHGTAFRHGDFYTSGVRFYPDELVIHKWENAKKIDKKSWGYRRNARLADYLTIAELIRELVATVSWGGNLLLNVGPTKDGVIDPAVEERLRQMGDWLSANGEAIYGSTPWEMQNDRVNENVWWTANRAARRIYGSILRWPEDNLLRVTPIKLSDDYRVCLLGPDCKYELTWKNTKEALEITLPIEARGVQPAWVFRVELRNPRFIFEKK